MELGFVVLMNLADIPDLFWKAIAWNFSMGCESWRRFRWIFVPENDPTIALEYQMRLLMRYLFIKFQINDESLWAYVILIELFWFSRLISLHNADRISSLGHNVKMIVGAVCPQKLYLIISTISGVHVVSLCATLFQLLGLLAFGTFCFLVSWSFWFLKL